MYFKNNINKKIYIKKNNMDKSINNSNRVRQILKIKKPVIQGPLFWFTDAKLVAAVSEQEVLVFLDHMQDKIFYQKMMKKKKKE